MKLEAVGVYQPAPFKPYQLRLKFEGSKFFTIELGRGQEASEVAEQLRQLAKQLDRVRP